MGGGHCAHCAPPPPPPRKNPVTFLRNHSSKVFWKVVQKWISWHSFSFHGNHGYLFKVVRIVKIFDWESLIKNQKPCSLCWKSIKVLFLKAYKNHAQSDMRVYPHSASQLKCHTWPVVAAAYHILAEGVCTALYMNVTGRSWAANHMLSGGFFTASYVKPNLAVRQPSLAQQVRAFSHFPPSTTTTFPWKPYHSRTESTANDMFVLNLTVKRLSSRPLDKSTSCIMQGPDVWDRSQCMWTSNCP